MDKNVALAFILTTLAGLSTTLGSLLGLAVRKPGGRFMSAALGFSAGVMVMVSFVGLLQGSIESIGFAYAHFGFFSGIMVIFFIDFFLPHESAAHRDVPEQKENSKLLRMGVLIAFGIGIHNFPEGMATFAGTLKDTRLGIAIAVAIAIHNIPEGLAISVPVYAATKSRGKAFLWSFLSGVAEPVGAVIAAVFLLPFLTPALLGWLLAFVAGVMVFIAFDELVPTSFSYNQGHIAILGVIFGMAVMALSLWMLK
jgi:ZIP family zinc transporter